MNFCSHGLWQNHSDPPEKTQRQPRLSPAPVTSPVPTAQPRGRGGRVAPSLHRTTGSPSQPKWCRAAAAAEIAALQLHTYGLLGTPRCHQGRWCHRVVLSRAGCGPGATLTAEPRCQVLRYQKCAQSSASKQKREGPSKVVAWRKMNLGFIKTRCQIPFCICWRDSTLRG